MSPIGLSYKSALRRILPLFLLCVLSAALLVSIFNDIYAFVKTDGEARIVLSSPVDEWELCEMLYERGVISRRLSFYIYLCRGNFSEKLSSLTGEWTLRTNMSYREIAAEFFQKTE